MVLPQSGARFNMRHRRGSAGFLLLLAGVAWTLSVQGAQAAAVQSVQSGTTTSTANGIKSVTITGVDPTKSFLIFQAASSSATPESSLVRGRLPTACSNPCTQIEFERGPHAGS